MRKNFLILGGILLAVALYLVALHNGQSIGAVWASIDPNSIVGFGSLIENKVSPDLWLDVFLPALQWQAWVIPAVLGGLLVLSARPSKRSGDNTHGNDTPAESDDS